MNKMDKVAGAFRFLSMALAVSVGCYSLISCQDKSKNKTHQNVSSSSIEKGKELANHYCRGCHLLPDPSWVDTKTWERSVLPHMGPMLGIFLYHGKTYPSSKFDVGLSRNYYPAKPLIDEESWQHILDYYVATSPDTQSIVQNRKNSIQIGLKSFEEILPTAAYTSPATCMVKFDTAHPAFPILISDAKRNTFYRLDKDFHLADSIRTSGPVVDVELGKKEWTLCNIGVLNPNNGNYGFIQLASINNKGHLSGDSAFLFRNLKRPVQVLQVDLNQDGKEDFLVCEFGFLEGSLSWLENIGNGNYDRHVIRNLPGAVKAIVNDYNQDGKPDIWALFTQGQEGIFLFTNLGNGTFSEKQILEFPPINGSTYFEFDDFNKDGLPDILYTCGDNADYSTVLKPFHGIYIYLNEGDNHFSEKCFFPMNGCYKAMARDFDHDGDLDIAAISFFADYEHQPEEGFVFLENKSNFNFSPHSPPAAQSGRWLSMDIADYDQDGDEDIILGNFSVKPSITQSKADWINGPPFIILRNNGRSNH